MGGSLYLIFKKSRVLTIYDGLKKYCGRPFQRLNFFYPVTLCIYENLLGVFKDLNFFSRSAWNLSYFGKETSVFSIPVVYCYFAYGNRISREEKKR